MEIITNMISSCYECLFGPSQPQPEYSLRDRIALSSGENQMHSGSVRSNFSFVGVSAAPVSAMKTNETAPSLPPLRLDSLRGLGNVKF